mgnify:CR=1 FL=1
MKVTMIYASTTDGLIGDGMKLPWHIKEDFAHFVKYTKGKPVLMGSTTAKTLPNGPLPNRTNYVLTTRCLRNYGRPHSDGFHYINSYKEIPECDELMIIGGAQIYEHFEPICQKIIWTEVIGDYSGDTYYKPKMPWANRTLLGESTCGRAKFWEMTR